MTNNTVNNPSQATATASLILGISSIVIPILGIITGSTAIILARITKKTQPSNTKATGGLITGIIGLVLSVMIGLTIILVSIFLAPTSGKPFDDMVAQKKDFEIGETMIIGNTELKVTNIETNYAPTAEESANVPDHISNEFMNSARSDYPKYKILKEVYDNSKITTANDEYVLVEGTLRINETTEKPSSGGTDLVTLNQYPVAYTLGAYGLWAPEPASNTEPPKTSFRAIFRIKEGSDALTLGYRTSIYRTVSPIVGTEGAKHANLDYSLRLK